MIFNKNNNGSEELRALTGNYYLNNEFALIKTDIDLATEDLIKIIGQPVLDKVQKAYDESTADLADLVERVQLPIALLATLKMSQKNDISHEDSGRKNKIDSNSEKLPWEWQLKRDDEIHMDYYYRAVDRLISYLDSKTYDEWKNSDYKKSLETLFIRNAEKFDQYFPIDRSGRLFVILCPFVREAQRLYIKPALGTDYATLLAGKELTTAQKELLEYIYPPIPLLAMSLAIRRLPLSIIPAGVVRNYVSGSQTMNGSNPASVSEVRALSSWLMDDALELVDLMKRQHNGTPVEFSMFPANDENKKYMQI